jgi:hypothetical protein
MPEEIAPVLPDNADSAQGTNAGQATEPAKVEPARGTEVGPVTEAPKVESWVVLPPTPITKDQLELQKLQVEIANAQIQGDKIKAETAALSHPFYKTYQFYAAIMPIFVAVAGLSFSWGSGWFDVQEKRLDARRLLLDFDVKQLETKKADQESQVRNLEAERSKLAVRVSTLSTERTNLLEHINQLEAQYGEFVRVESLIGEIIRTNPSLPWLRDLFRPSPPSNVHITTE